MNLDSHTLQTMNGVVVALCTVGFTLNTAFKLNDTAGRMWSLAYVAGMMTIVAHAVGGQEPTTGWANLVGNITVVVAVAAVWAGARRFNGRRVSPYIAAGMAALGLLTIVTTLIDGSGAHPTSSVVVSLSVALLAVFGGAEFVRGRLRRNLNARIVAVTLGLAALAAALRALMFLADGLTGTVFTTQIHSIFVSTMTLCLVTLGTIALSVLRAESISGSAVGDLTDGIHSAAGVLSNTAFTQAATDHLARAEEADVALALIGADIDNLPEINTAFGRMAGDEAIARFAAKLRGSAPVMSLIGHRSSGRFQVLVVAAAGYLAHDLAEQMQIALVEEPLHGTALIRLTASFGIASTGDHGYSLYALDVAATAAIDTVKADGGNGVALDPAPGAANSAP
ncbi:diguanylate cyclase [Cryobacterium sp. PH29-G1]|uniref:GGDEF domain-containing protein n=1 Tax=Cryobacterium sp. PH29-G1 TaxID=3046211 RepID=UPI0024BB44C6|nr:diguanylate cyclase [Cryobacterium sp. PH29-G1]MDJ0350026.1 diguanylate cyclase [Cryobacterium sp. PH29-G1]